MSIKNQILELKQFVQNHNCKVIAVSKTYPAKDITTAYEAGQLDFGENKVQELIEKQPHLPNDIRWHLIGHLQRNKVKYIAPFVYMIHSVDSIKLIKEIDKQAKKENRTIKCLLQVHIAEEESKFGIHPDKVVELIKDESIQAAQNVNIVGLMGMATFTDDESQIRNEFKILKSIFDNLKNIELPSNVKMEELSMGMSSDYKIAIDEGSTMVRVGSAIFGERNYA